jgi:hypothetical protein
MKGWQKNILFVVIAGVLGLVMYFGAKFFGLIGGKEDPQQ